MAANSDCYHVAFSHSQVDDPCILPHHPLGMTHYLGMLFILVKSLTHERAVIREFLIVEVRNNLIPVNEYALLQDAKLRLKDEHRVLIQSGFRQWLRVRALYQTCIGLTFRKWHVSMGDKPKLGYIQPEDAYRQRIKRLRNEIAQGEMRGRRSR